MFESQEIMSGKTEHVEMTMEMVGSVETKEGLVESVEVVWENTGSVGLMAKMEKRVQVMAQMEENFLSMVGVGGS